MCIPSQQLLLKQRKGEGRYYQVSCGGGGCLFSGHLDFLQVLRMFLHAWHFFQPSRDWGHARMLRLESSLERWHPAAPPSGQQGSHWINYHPPPHPRIRETTRRAWVSKVSPDVGGRGRQQQREGKCLFDRGSWNITKTANTVEKPGSQKLAL